MLTNITIVVITLAMIIPVMIGNILALVFIMAAMYFFRKPLFRAYMKIVVYDMMRTFQIESNKEDPDWEAFLNL